MTVRMPSWRSIASKASFTWSSETRFVTSRVALDDVNAAFEALERQDGIRTVITFDA